MTSEFPRESKGGVEPSRWSGEGCSFSRTNLPVEGRVSIDRSMVAALLSTTPRQVPRSSTDDSVQEPLA